MEVGRSFSNAPPPIRIGSPLVEKIILDCDPGHDDAIAILLAAGNPDIDLLAITTVAGNQTLEKVTRNAMSVCAAGGITVPIAAGAAGPLVRPQYVAEDIHGDSGLDGPVLPAATTELAQVRLALAGRQVSRVVRLARTLLDGYRTYEFSDDPWLRRRAVQGRARLENLRLLLSGPSAAREAERALRESVERDFDRLLGPQSLPDRALAMTAQALREVQGAVRRATETPAAPVCHYRWGGADNGRRRDRFSAD